MSIEKFQPSYDVYTDRFEKLKAIVPEAFADGKINWDKLKECLGNFVEEEGDEVEHYAFTWPGKRKARRLAGKPPQGTLVPAPGEGVDEEKTDNIFIEGDNLEVLKLLQKSYAGKVKMIYIDPPYNTGNDFIYNDNFTQPLEEYLKLTRQIDGEGSPLVSNKKSEGRFHSNWLNMIYPRLMLGWNLLRNDGVIFISVDDNEVINLRKICDDTFGEERHIATLTVINNLKGRNDKANVATCHEYLMIYAKETFESYGLPLTEEQLNEYKYVDEKDEKYALRDLRKRGRPDRREDRPQMFFPVYFNKETKECYLERKSNDDIEIFPKRGDNSDGRWRWGKDKVAANLQYLHPRYSNKKNRWDIDHRVYLNIGVMSEVGDEEADDDDLSYQRTSKSKSFWWGSEISTDIANREFKKLFPGINPDYPKSPFFIEKILYMGLKQNDLVMDFFSGYSTTAQAVLELNKLDGGTRKFLLVQLPEAIDETKNPEAFNYCRNNGKPASMAELGKERIRQVIKCLKENGETVNQDFGFKVLKLQPSHFKGWKDYSGRDVKELMELFTKQEDALVGGWKPEDLLIEVMLQEGFPLNSKVELMTEIDKNKVYKITSNFCEHSLFICFDKSVDQNSIDTLPLSDKDIFICLDSALTDQQKVILSDKGVIKTI